MLTPHLHPIHDSPAAFSLSEFIRRHHAIFTRRALIFLLNNHDYCTQNILLEAQRLAAQANPDCITPTIDTPEIINAYNSKL